jgi:hypothetical protein
MSGGQPWPAWATEPVDLVDADLVDADLALFWSWTRQKQATEFPRCARGQICRRFAGLATTTPRRRDSVMDYAHVVDFQYRGTRSSG